MTFAQPWWLMVVPLLVPFVLLLHARRRRDFAVAHLALWRRVPATTVATPQRRRVPWRDPRMWLQVLTIVVVAGALARPSLGSDGRTLHWVVVVDASTSMNAIDVEPSRFEAAVATVAERWAAVSTGDRVSIVRAGAFAEVVAARWPTGRALDAAVARLVPGDGAPDWAGAAVRVRALRAAEGDVRVVVLTDRFGAAAARDALAGVVGVVGDAQPQPIDLVVLGDALVNVGVGDVVAVPRGDRVDQWTVSGRVATVGVARGETLRMVAAYRPFGGDTFLPWGAVDVTLDGAGEATFELPLDLPGPGELELRGPGGDRLPVDDRVVVPLRLEPRRVAVVGARPTALLRALASIDDLEVFVADAVPEPETAAALDLVVVAGDVEGVPATSTLWLGSVPTGTAAGDPITDVANLGVGAHPLVRDVDPAAIRVDRAVPLRPLAGTTPLLTAGDALLAWARTTTDGRQVVVGFGLDDGDWAAQLSFPAFIAAVVDWAAPRSWSHVPSGCVVGRPCPWPADAFAGGWTLRDPSGVTAVAPHGPRSVDGDPLASAVWNEAWFDAGFTPPRAGRYALVRADGVVGLPVVTSPIGGEPAIGGDALPAVPTSATRQLARWLAMLAVVVALVDAGWSWRVRVLGVRRAAWRPVAWTITAAIAWALAAGGVPLPVPGAGGMAVWIGPEGRPDALTGGGWSWRSVGLQAIGGEPFGDGQPHDTSSPVASDLATALELALALPVDGGARRVVVDATATSSTERVDAWDVLERARDMNVSIDVLSTLPAAADVGGRAAIEGAADVSLAQLWVPDRVRAGARFTLGASILAPDGVAWRWTAELLDVLPAPVQASPVGTSAAVSPEPSGGAEAVGEGTGRAEIDLRAGAAGTHRYRLELRHDDDATPASATIVSVMVGRPLSVLVVAPDGPRGTRLIEALTTQSIEVRRVTPFRLPSSLDAIAVFDAVALVDVAASELFTAYQEMLEAYVRERGGGLVIFGGPQAFGPGGYFRTPLEELSPLSAQITEDAPEVAMAFVLDRSGSMNGAVGTATRMDVAKVATLEALALLGEQSQAALIVFDVEAQVLLPFRPVGDVPAFEAALTRVNAAGGTSILPGLVAAYELIRTSEAATRHVVVMTDGLSQEGDFATVLGRLQAMGVTTSFVGVGDAADRRQLTVLAGLGGGALHMALDFRALPSLLAQEALMLSATPIEERPTRVAWAKQPGAVFLEGVADAPPPPLAGYVQTTAKGDAVVHAFEHQAEHPILASWRYGLGRVAAFASDADGPWSDAWTAAPSYARLWSQVLRWTGERPVDAGWTLAVAGAGGALDAVVTWPAGVDGVGRPVELVTAEGRLLASQPLEGSSDGRGWVRFEIVPTFEDELIVRLPTEPADDLDAPLERRLAWPPTPMRALRADLVALEAVVEASGGTWWSNGVDDFPRVGPTWRWRQRPETWLVLGLVSFVVGLVLRYGAWGAWFGASRRRR